MSQCWCPQGQEPSGRLEGAFVEGGCGLQRSLGECLWGGTVVQRLEVGGAALAGAGDCVTLTCGDLRDTGVELAAVPELSNPFFLEVTLKAPGQSIVLG